MNDYLNVEAVEPETATAARVNKDEELDLIESEGLFPAYCDPTYRMPDEIEVKVTFDGGDYYFPVSIVKRIAKKPYLGGYRNKINGKIYHHSNTQTPRDNKNATTRDMSNLRSRETQTAESRTLSVQCYRESGTQMEKVYLCIDNSRDKIIVSKQYQTASELLVIKITKSILIQRYWRGYVARCLAHVLRMQNIEFARITDEESELQHKSKVNRELEEAHRRTQPQSNTDFEILFNELASWRQKEIQRIKMSSMDESTRVAAMSEILSKETKALQSIQTLKAAARRGIQDEKTRNLLELMAQPQKWQLSNGEICAVQTPATTRAKELLEAHNSLSVLPSSVDGRLDILLHVKWLVRQYGNGLSRDIVDLVDREADLLTRGRSISSMGRLRERLGTLFLQFVQSPEYNPRSSDFI